jgi:hypothetical protein
MDTNQIREILKRDKLTKSTLLGVYARDMLPDTSSRRYPFCCVANTDPSESPGEHWIAMYFDAEGRGEFFCSYGSPPHQRDFDRFLRRNSRNWIYNDTCLQSADSLVCGHYCIFYLYHKCLGYSMFSIVQMFSNNRRRNDHIVSKFVKERYSRNISLTAGVGQCCVCKSRWHDD